MSATITCSDYGIFIDTRSTSVGKLGVFRFLAGIGPSPEDGVSVPEGCPKMYFIANRYVWLKHPDATAASDTYAARGPLKGSAGTIVVSDAEKTSMDALKAAALGNLAGLHLPNDGESAVYQYAKNNIRPEGDI